MNKENTATNFCKSFKFILKLQWFDRTGIMKLPNGKLAKIQLKTTGTMGQYEKFVVSIINKKEGVIDQQSFNFNAYLKERIDSKSDYKGDFKVIDHCGWKWYIAVPKSTRTLEKAIEDYINYYK